MAGEPVRRISPTQFRVARRGTSREINRQIALNLIRSKEPISRAELARLMGVRRGAVSRLVDELLTAGIVFEGAKGESTRGRKPMHLHIETRRRCVAAVDVSASHTAVLLTGRVAASAPTDVGASASRRTMVRRVLSPSTPNAPSSW